MSTALNRSDDRLPHALTARDLYLEACTSAQTGVIFMGREDTPDQWWNWYMTAPQGEWETRFRVTTNTSEALVQSHGWAHGQPIVQVDSAAPNGDATATMPGKYDRPVVHFLSNLARTLNNHGCAYLRGIKHTV